MKSPIKTLVFDPKTMTPEIETYLRRLINKTLKSKCKTTKEREEVVEKHVKYIDLLFSNDPLTICEAFDLGVFSQNLIQIAPVNYVLCLAPIFLDRIKK
jgi:hypothetical protein